MGFYKEKVYLLGPVGMSEMPISFYVNLGVVSFFMVGVEGMYGFVIYSGLMQPIGIGVMTATGILTGSAIYPPLRYFAIATLHKAGDNWVPPRE